MNLIAPSLDLVTVISRAFSGFVCVCNEESVGESRKAIDQAKEKTDRAPMAKPEAFASMLGADASCEVENSFRVKERRHGGYAGLKLGNANLRTVTLEIILGDFSVDILRDRAKSFRCPYS